MDSKIIWLVFIWSILSLLIASIARFRETEQNNFINSRILNRIKSSFHFLKQKTIERAIELPEYIKNVSFISTYNFRNILSFLPFIQKMPLSKQNRFVKAFIYDYDNRISRHNYVVNSSLTFKKIKRVKNEQ
ncbi:MAG: hypothetical protein K9H48_14305 [Melioribacteraceae bacterium]|nr:hypothetical protein [Melioribacteraceae bacterium]MCF8395124.1 hypothetical protein [Melioribacteraceae bacterium]MCF8420533.1 hypothetical protein [Melioribacteraceae bacterium]